MILTRFEDNARTSQTLLNMNVEWRITLTDAMAKLWELLQSGSSVESSGYSL